MIIEDFLTRMAPILATTFVAVFLIDYVANLISFGNRFISAIVTALVLMAILSGGLFAMGEDIALEPLLMAGGLMFVVALLGNLLSFRNRFLNALLTAVIFMIPYALGLYFLIALGAGVSQGG